MPLDNHRSHDTPRTFLLLAAICALPVGALAQRPRAADTLAPRAIADSQEVLASLTARLQKNVNDGAAWYRQGLVAWALADRARAANPPRALDATRLYRLADSSLRVAAEVAPANATYRLTVGKFLLASGNPITRAGANVHFAKAVTVARASNDSAALGEAAVEYGRVFWRQYDALQNRRMTSSAVSVAHSMSDLMQPIMRVLGMLEEAAGGGAHATKDQQIYVDAQYGSTPQQSLRSIEDLIKDATLPLPASLNGRDDMRRASELFREAYAATPMNPRTFRSVAMVLADDARWGELSDLARGHVRALPWDPAGWMALGLALHRGQKTAAAAAAFDSGMVLMSPAERSRYDRIERVLRPLDSSRTAASAAATRAAYARTYWLLADRLWSRDGNEERLEFLARVEFAELRWTVDELGVRGAETDRGDTYIRYGPPDIVVALQPIINGGNVVEDHDIAIYWVYKSGLMFSFSGMPMYGSAHTPDADRGIAEALRNLQPVRWDNLPGQQIDSLPVQVTRFRAAPDSVDILVATRADVDSVARSSEVNEPTRSWFFLVGSMPPAYVDSSHVNVAGVQAWTRRVRAGDYVYRVEVGSPTAAHAGRATARLPAREDSLSGFSISGFGLSDLLLATATDPGHTTPLAIARWTALRPSPLVTALTRGAPLTVVWENYGLADRNGTAEYSVSLRIAPAQSGAGQVVARIIGALASVARIDRRSDGVAVSFERSVPHASAFADQIAVDLGTTPVGAYALTVEITDKVTGARTLRKRAFQIRD